MSEETSSSSIDFGELAHTEKFTSAVLKLDKQLDKTKNMLDIIENENLDNLSVKDQVGLDLYMSYAVSSLYWMYLRTKGLDSSKLPIKLELDRVKESIVRANKVHNRKRTIVVDKAAAKRFIHSSLWEPGQKKLSDEVKET